MGSHGGTAPTNLGFVHDVVVNERREVDHFHDHRSRDMRIVNTARRAGAQREQSWAQLLALVAQSVFGKGRNFGVKTLDLLCKAFSHRAQERFRRGHYLLPGERWILSYCGGRNRKPAEFGSQHLAKRYGFRALKSNCLSLIDSRLSRFVQERPCLSTGNYSQMRSGQRSRMLSLWQASLNS